MVLLFFFLFFFSVFFFVSVAKQKQDMYVLIFQGRRCLRHQRRKLFLCLGHFHRNYKG